MKFETVKSSAFLGSWNIHRRSREGYQDDRCSATTTWNDT